MKAFKKLFTTSGSNKSSGSDQFSGSDQSASDKSSSSNKSPKAKKQETQASKKVNQLLSAEEKTIKNDSERTEKYIAEKSTANAVVDADFAMDFFEARDKVIPGIYLMMY